MFVVGANSSATAAAITFSDEASFLASSSSLSLESFEGLTATNNRLLTNLSLSDFDMTMSSGDRLGVFDVTAFFGGHATDGKNYIGFSDGHSYVDYVFDSAIDTFGINITDFGDFGRGSITFSNNAGDNFTAAITGLGNANEQFFGIISDFAFTTVRLSQNISGEFYAIDEIYYGNQPIPEPTTMLLFGTGLAGLAAVGRRRK